MENSYSGVNKHVSILMAYDLNSGVSLEIFSVSLAKWDVAKVLYKGFEVLVVILRIEPMTSASSGSLTIIEVAQ